jgi:hypothetical protein
LGLRFTSLSLLVDMLRECYEAFVIYSFYQLLLAYLGGEAKLVSILAKKPTQPHMLPFCCLPPWRMSDRFQIKFSAEEVKSLQEAMQEVHSRRQSEAGPPPPPGPQQQRIDEAANGDVEERKEEEASSSSSSTTSSPHITVTPASSSSSSTSNSQPDYSAAASSPELLRAPGAPVERPVFSTRAPHIPDTYLSPYSRPNHSDFLTHTQLGTLQYCLVRPATALTAFILSLLDLYGESNFDWSKGYPYLAFITNMSQIWSMYSLVIFYVCLKEDLAPLKPIPKFLCVKAVVFFTFWQSVLLVLLAEFDVIKDGETYSKDEIVVALQDFIVCLEMLFAALAHHYAFSWREFHDPVVALQQPPPRVLPALFEALNVTDVYVADVRRVTTKSLRTKRKHNKLLTREEMVEEQYATFVAEMQSNNEEGGGASSAMVHQLSEPLNADRTLDQADFDAPDIEGGGAQAASPASTYLSPAMPPSPSRSPRHLSPRGSGSRSPLAGSRSPRRRGSFSTLITLQQTRSEVREEEEDGGHTVTVRTEERMTITPRDEEEGEEAEQEQSRLLEVSAAPSSSPKIEEV